MNALAVRHTRNIIHLTQCRHGWSRHAVTLAHIAKPPIARYSVSSSQQSVALSSLSHYSSARPITTRFNFDTYKLVRQLELQGLTRGQAVAIMRTINAFLVDDTMAVRAATLSTVELENEIYLYKAQLQELRNELQLLRQNDSASLKADTETTIREIESLHQKFVDILASLKGEVAMDLNNHKADSRELGTDTDLRIQEIHHKLVLKLSDLKTKIETMKVEMTQMIVWMVIGLVSAIIVVDMFEPSPQQEEQKVLPYQKPSMFPFFGLMSTPWSKPSPVQQRNKDF
ncbi:hypothetical protein BATDEDRAFT_32705 [Batrachochytrium dendrobatidis JAM81]|uniref:DUF1640 domain-containing protein n=2 Tax=Batrachochytrium dendrobatidis TaxID=109871 RepID=F4NVL9_BATDJ|nr:uncharacterized protein BATDEDRAFT_32705 [Batrachochytrium dendrobatidis JAM81]EGF83296.1 hypothetical protein BATDEDRAFT_32705 [Batrachochytrium dendrobatidis JAM81]KAJ8325474.1 hypothetical protein O5D80_005699 [Batrachochytrium dendrobatidis]KAK5671539.1 hypothetical protein QVD99_002242 [Batrachochytrium dendrobatidis]OAJ36647.1 hypothetical protein BDEG_20800 [Batrachochytrium dendrobatidis JEL423]|eukprot:XP_006675664.1 hypothetical protein BATDEDRAFT_32705 [Batrachochytrium dendrobatidis JAM81]